MGTKIELNAIRKGFALNGGVLQVVEDVSLTVGDGEFVAIVGPSGCGKTDVDEHGGGIRAAGFGCDSHRWITARRTQCQGHTHFTAGLDLPLADACSRI